MIVFIIMLVGVIVLAWLIPEQVVIDIASSIVEIAVVLGVFTIFKFMFPRDRANRQRVRGGPYGSVYIARNMYCIALSSAILFLIFYHFALHPTVTAWIAAYVYEAGHLSGVTIIGVAMSLIIIMGYQVLNSFEYRL